eukprot:5472546-Pleurochrysis_carterae.AAC.2
MTTLNELRDPSSVLGFGILVCEMHRGHDWLAQPASSSARFCIRTLPLSTSRPRPLSLLASAPLACLEAGAMGRRGHAAHEEFAASERPLRTFDGIGRPSHSRKSGSNSMSAGFGTEAGS